MNRVLSVFSILFIFVSFFLHGETYINNLNRLSFILFFIIIFFLFSSTICKKHNLITYFGFLVFLFIGQRLVFMSFYTAHNFEHNYYLPYMVNHTIIELSLYLFIFYINLLLLNSSFQKVVTTIKMHITFIKNAKLKFKISILFFVISTLISIIVTQKAGLNGINNANDINFATRYFTRFIYPEFFLVFAISLYFLKLRNSGISKKTIICLVIVYLISTILNGSKEGFFCILLQLLFYFSFFNNTFLIKINLKMIGAIFGVLLFSLFSFLIIAYIRAKYWYNIDTDVVLSIGKKDNILIDTLGTISRRLSIIEDSIKINYWKVLGFTDISRYVNIQSALKLSLDSLIPSTLYPNLLKSQFALSLMLDNNPVIINGKEIYAGYWWGFYSYHKYLFGLIPGLIVMTLFIQFTFIFIRIIIAQTSITFNVVFIFLFTTNFFYYFIGFFGYEHILSFYVDGLIRMGINFLILIIFLKMIRLQNKIHK